MGSLRLAKKLPMEHNKPAELVYPLAVFVPILVIHDF
jgi:hypothetical protein